MKLALCQPAVGEDKKQNLENARVLLLKAADAGAEMAILPEMFNIVYRARFFEGAAEPCPGGETSGFLREIARETGLYLIGGTVPEREGERLYNTAMIYDGAGAFRGKYRKAHLFDVDIPESNYRFHESDVFAPGNEPPLLLPDAPMPAAVAICFDIRFPEWARFAMDGGAELLALPAAFAMATGPRHWELLIRARALDNQMFVAGVAPAQSPYAYGHSMVATPDGRVLRDCGAEPGLAVVEIDRGIVRDMRMSIPVKALRRKDLYRLERVEG